MKIRFQVNKGGLIRIYKNKKKIKEEEEEEESLNKHVSYILGIIIFYYPKLYSKLTIQLTTGTK